MIFNISLTLFILPINKANATMSIKKNNPNYEMLTFQQLLDSKKLTETQINKEWINLSKKECKENKKCFTGNKILYHYQFKELLKTKRDVKNYLTMEEIFNDPTQKKIWIDNTIKADRIKKNDFITSNCVFECYRLYKGSINFFKPFTTKYLCKRFNASSVLDPTAGWGGRLLGARSLNLQYTGIDTNINLKEGYDEMIKRFGGAMIYDSCLDVDFSKINYDFVLTSPPYINIEKYSNMPLFESNEKYYKEFLIPLINKCLKYIKVKNKESYVCINISNYMYEDYLRYGGLECDETIDLQQQMGGKPNKEVIYVWTKKQKIIKIKK